MRKAGGSGLLVLGIVIVVFGFLIGSDLVEGILDIVKWLLVIIGVVLGVMGLVQMFSGGGKRSSGYSDF